MALMLVSAVALQAADGRILMQQRPASRQHGALWEFPGGKLEAQETPLDAAIRECAEELGITLDPAACTALGFAQTPLGSAPLAKPVLILLFLCTSWSGQPRPLDGQQLAWLAPAAIPALPMPPLDYPLAQSLLAHLRP